MQKLLISLFDLIFPPRVDAVLLRECTEEDVTKLFHLTKNDEIFALSEYHHKYIRALVHEMKFHRNPKAQLLLAQLVASFLQSNEMHFDYIFPIPLSKARMRSRGYNQVYEILRVRKLSVPICTDVLMRMRDTRAQTELKRAERLTNMHDAFGVVHSEKITGKHILIVDDVTTTGATLKAAKAALLPHNPASITLLALTH